MGIAIVFISCLYIGSSCAAGFRKQIAELSAFILLIEHMRAKIKYFGTPIGDIFRDFKNETLDGVSFCKIAEKEGFNRALDRTLSSLHLDAEALAGLREFGSGLGTRCREEETERCGYYIDILNKKAAGLRLCEPSKTKLYKSLGVTAGVLISILLI